MSQAQGLDYSPQLPPEQLDLLSDYVYDELKEIAGVLEGSTVFQLRVLHVEPAKLEDGLLALADGSNWNPGSGAGLYIYQNTAWTFLGGIGSNPNLFETVVAGATNLTADSPTDTLTLVAGSGISITGDAGTDTVTIANTGVLTSPNLFQVVNADGTSLVADSPTDTLNIIAGTGITISGVAGTDTLTISATGSVTYGYGEIYVETNGSGQVLDSNYELLDFDVGGSAGSNGLATNTTPDETNSKITVDVAGNWKVMFSGCFNPTNTQTPDAVQKYEFQIRVNDLEPSHVIRCRQEIGDSASTNMIQNASMHGILALSANDEVSVWVRENNSDATMDIVMISGSLIVELMEPS